MRTLGLAVSLSLLLATLALVPSASAGPVNCPAGYVGVLVTQPSGNPFGTCCRATLPPTYCRLYRLDPIGDLLP